MSTPPCASASSSANAHADIRAPNRAAAGQSVASLVPGLTELWTRTTGDSRVRVAILDGPPNLHHPALAGARTVSSNLLQTTEAGGAAREHGTRVCGLVLGQTPVHDASGIAPRCTGVLIPVFRDDPNVHGAIEACTDGDLATAIDAAIALGAHIINVSAGRPLDGEVDECLLDALRHCEQRGVLVVAAAGNDGCACPLLPAAAPFAVAVGASGGGVPTPFSNWGDAYAENGLLAPGHAVRAPSARGGWAVCQGTSYATPIVSGVAALLMSLQLQENHKVDARAVRAALLEGTDPCPHGNAAFCQRFMRGLLNVSRSVLLITTQGARNMNELETQSTVDDAHGIVATSQTTEMNSPIAESMALQHGPPPATPSALPLDAAVGVPVPRAEPNPQVIAAECACGGSGGAATSASVPPQIAFPLGTLGYDFGTEARLDSFVQAMGSGSDPRHPEALLSYLETNPHLAGRLIWTLNIDQTPIFALAPHGPYAHVAFERLRQVLSHHIEGKSERVAIAGTAVGRVNLQNGQPVPVLVPEPSAIWDWDAAGLIQAVTDGADETTQQGLHNFLQRVYYEVRNMGLEPRERALNYAATNAFQAEQVFSESARAGLELESLAVQPSPICRPGSLCHDVTLSFFNPRERLNQARRVYRFTVDVSDVIPVTVGEIRQWSVY